MDHKSKLDYQYLVIGKGAMASHFIYYLTQLKLPFFQWDQSKDIDLLIPLLSASSHILFLIKDDAIDSFIETYCLKYKKQKSQYIHFSGALISKYAYTAHPLQTFAPNMQYSLKQYLEVPFAIETEGPKFDELLPGLSNKHFKIQRNEKPYYHALGAIANNFTTLLWQKYFRELEHHFNIDPKLAIPLLTQTLHNLTNNPNGALTGPIARKDMQTINNHLNALRERQDHFFDIYKIITETHLNLKTKDNKENECA